MVARFEHVYIDVDSIGFGEDFTEHVCRDPRSYPQSKQMVNS